MRLRLVSILATLAAAVVMVDSVVVPYLHSLHTVGGVL